MKIKLLVAASFIASIAIFIPAAEADEAALFACVRKYTDLGITPDTALAECKQKSLATCINSLLGTEQVLVSTTRIQPTGKSKGGYLIDLGDNQDTWLEGGGWRDRGCVPYVGGASKTSRIGDPFNGETKLEWFAQGICPTSDYKTGMRYSFDTAEKACKIRAIKESV